MSRDPLTEYQDWLRRDQRRRRLEAVIMWTLLALAAIGAGYILVGFVGTIVGLL